MERYDLPMSVPFVHRVCFTRDSFAVDNSLLRDLLSEGGGRRVLVFLEAAVADAWPLLTAQIQSYFSVGNVTHSGTVVGFGGEPAKADDHLVGIKLRKKKLTVIPMSSASAAAHFSMLLVLASQRLIEVLDF